MLLLSEIKFYFSQQRRYKRCRDFFNDAMKIVGGGVSRNLSRNAQRYNLRRRWFAREPASVFFFFVYFFSYIDLLDESQTKLSSDLLDSRQSISQIQVIYIVISEEDQKWTQENFGSIILCTIFCFKLRSLFKINSSSGLQFFFNMRGILLNFVHKMPHKHLFLSSFWILFWWPSLLGSFCFPF